MFHIEFKILVSAFVSVDLLCIPVFWRIPGTTFFIPDASVQIDVSGLKYSLIKLVVKSSSAYRNVICMNCKDVAQWLSFLYKRRDHLIQFSKFFLSHVYANPGVHKCVLIFSLSCFCMINMLFHMTTASGFTSITNIRRLKGNSTSFYIFIWTVPIFIEAKTFLTLSSTMFPSAQKS